MPTILIYFWPFRDLKGVMESLALEYRKTEDLIPFINNPRTHSEEQIAQIAASIRFFGFSNPILVDNENGVIAGHGRLLAARKLKMELVPTIELSSLTPLQRRALIIADNRIAENAGWDAELLSIELESLREENFEVGILGFTQEEIDDLLKEEVPQAAALTDEDDVPKPSPVAKTRIGDLWMLGDHRLLCGDATSVEDVRRVMGGERAKLFATDPPYLVDYDGTNRPPDKTKDWSAAYIEQPYWDDSSQGPRFYDQFISTAIAEALGDNVAWYCWYASVRHMMVEQAWRDAGAFMHQQIVWVKTRAALSRCVYSWQHESCLFGWVKGKKPSLSREAFDRWPTTVWNIPSGEVECDEHPTSKPVRVFTVPMELHTAKNDVCYEPFAGSGSQYIAGEKLGRRVFGLELSPIFCDVIIRRWQAYTGRTAEREGGEAFDDIDQEVAPASEPVNGTS